MTGHGPLNVDGTLDGLDDTRKFRQKAVSHQLHDPALALVDAGLNEVAAQRFQALKRAGLVIAHQA